MCGRHAVLKQLRLEHVCSTVSGVVCPILTLPGKASWCLLLDTFESWGWMYPCFLVWVNSEVESVIQWVKHPPDTASLTKSVDSHPFLGLTSVLCWSCFPCPFPVGCSPCGAGVAAPLLLTGLSNTLCLSPPGALCCSSRGGTTRPFSSQDFPANSWPRFEACSPLPPPNKIHFLIHDLIPHIIFQPSCAIGSRVCTTLISLPAQRQFLLNFGLLLYFLFGAITSLATYIDTERHIMKAQPWSQEKQSHDLHEANSPKLPSREHRSPITAGLFMS